jgi:hypothetical protein
MSNLSHDTTISWEPAEGTPIFRVVVNAKSKIVVEFSHVALLSVLSHPENIEALRNVLRKLLDSDLEEAVKIAALEEAAADGKPQ